jgi:hemoglobin
MNAPLHVEITAEPTPNPVRCPAPVADATAARPVRAPIRALLQRPLDTTAAWRGRVAGDWRRELLGSLLMLLLAACQTSPLAPPERTLFQDLGGVDGITAIVDRFLFNLADDPRIGHHFAETNVKRFREKLIEQVCELSGGPCDYTGDTMAQSHGGMGVDHADFNALVEDLIEAMEAERTPTTAQNRLLALLAPMHEDIIEN